MFSILHTIAGYRVRVRVKLGIRFVSTLSFSEKTSGDFLASYLLR
jgi:hypothetical protein